MQAFDALDIQFNLRRAGYSQADIARSVGVSGPLVSRVIHGKDRCLRVEQAIIDVIGRNPWPEAIRRRTEPGGATI